MFFSQVQSRMPSPTTNYRSFLDTLQERDPGSWKSFYVLVAGITNGAHWDFVQKLKRLGLSEVNSPAECDYILVFCPVASRVGTDVTEALNKIPAGKPVILVVMHHTFNPEHVVAESRRLVNNPDVYLTVDCLFYEDRFLECGCNRSAWSRIRESLGISQDHHYVPFDAFTPNNCLDLLKRRIWIILVVLFIFVMLVVLIVTLSHSENINMYNKTKMNEQLTLSL